MTEYYECEDCENNTFKVIKDVIMGIEICDFWICTKCGRREVR